MHASELMTATPATYRPDQSVRDCRSGWKRAMDVGIALARLVLLAPALLAVAVVVKIASSGPAACRQRRIGKHGVPFTMRYLQITSRGRAGLSGVRRCEQCRSPVRQRCRDDYAAKHRGLQKRSVRVAVQS